MWALGGAQCKCSPRVYSAYVSRVPAIGGDLRFEAQLHLGCQGCHKPDVGQSGTFAIQSKTEVVHVLAGSIVSFTPVCGAKLYIFAAGWNIQKYECESFERAIFTNLGSALFGSTSFTKRDTCTCAPRFDIFEFLFINMCTRFSSRLMHIVRSIVARHCIDHAFWLMSHPFSICGKQSFVSQR